MSVRVIPSYRRLGHTRRLRDPARRWVPTAPTAAAAPLGIARTGPILRSRPEFASGAGTGVLALMQGVFLDANVVLDVGHQSSITFPADRNQAWVDLAVPGTVVWLPVRGTTLEWWIADRDDVFADRSGGVVRFRAEPLHTLLADVGPIEVTTTGGVKRINLGGPQGGMSATNYWYTYLRPWLIEKGVDYVELGSVESNQRVDISWSAKNPQQVWALIAEELGHEWRLRRDDAASNYKLDMGLTLGSTDPVARATEGINLRSLRRTRDREDLATAVRPIGTLPPGGTIQSDISQAAWRVPTSGVSGDDVQAEAVNGLAGPIAEDGQWVGEYLEAPDGGFWEIEGTVAATQTFELETGAGTHFADGDLFRIVDDDQGTSITEISSPSALTNFKRIAKPLPLAGRGEWNRVRNPHYDDFATAPALHHFQFDGSHVSVTSLNLKGLTNGLVIEAGDAIQMSGRIVDQCRVKKVTVGGTVSGGTVTVTVSESTSASADEWASLWIIKDEKPASHDRLPDGTDQALVMRRPWSASALADLSGNIDGAQTVSNTAGLTLALKNLQEDDKLYPGDLITGPGSQAIWVGEEATVAADGTVTVKAARVGSSTGFSDNDAVTINRPLADSELPSSYALAMPQSPGPASGTPGGRLGSVVSTINPIPGLDNIYATCGFTAMSDAAQGWASTGELTPPRVRLMESAAEVAGKDAADWSPAAAAEKMSFRIQTDALALSAQGSYSVEIRAPNHLTNDATVFASGPWIYPHWVMIHVGEVGDVVAAHGSRGTSLAQRAQLRLTNNNEWASTYTCDLLDLAEQLQVSPAVVRASLGAFVHINCPHLGINGQLRIQGLKFNIHDPAKVEVVLDKRLKLVTQKLRKQATRQLFGRVEIETSTGELIQQTFIPQEPPPLEQGLIRPAAVSDADLTSAVAVPLVEVT